VVPVPKVGTKRRYLVRSLYKQPDRVRMFGTNFAGNAVRPGAWATRRGCAERAGRRGSRRGAAAGRCGGLTAERSAEALLPTPHRARWTQSMCRACARPRNCSARACFLQRSCACRVRRRRRPQKGMCVRDAHACWLRARARALSRCVFSTCRVRRRRRPQKGMCVRGAHACWLRARSLSLSLARARAHRSSTEKSRSSRPTVTPGKCRHSLRRR